MKWSQPILGYYSSIHPKQLMLEPHSLSSIIVFILKKKFLKVNQATVFMEQNFVTFDEYLKFSLSN
jgi:hypothetical protein